MKKYYSFIGPIELPIGNVYVLRKHIKRVNGRWFETFGIFLG